MARNPRCGTEDVCIRDKISFARCGFVFVVCGGRDGWIDVRKCATLSHLLQRHRIRWDGSNRQICRREDQSFEPDAILKHTKCCCRKEKNIHTMKSNTKQPSGRSQSGLKGMSWMGWNGALSPHSAASRCQSFISVPVTLCASGTSWTECIGILSGNESKRASHNWNLHIQRHPESNWILLQQDSMLLL